FSSLAMFLLKKRTRTPQFVQSSITSCTRGMPALRSRCTPKMLKPAFASARALAAPKPEDEPRISAHLSAMWLSPCLFVSSAAALDTLLSPVIILRYANSQSAAGYAATETVEQEPGHL